MHWPVSEGQLFTGAAAVVVVAASVVVVSAVDVKTVLLGSVLWLHVPLMPDTQPLKFTVP
jgi:hypothetical protein